VLDNIGMTRFLCFLDVKMTSLWCMETCKSLNSSLYFPFLEESVEERDSTLLRNITVPVHKVSENVPVSVLIDLFVKRKTHLFIVHDNYGQTTGVVTLEDAIETLLGVEIVDEMDEVEDMQAFAKDKSKQFQDKLLVEKKRLQKQDLNK
jgi:CBS domain containing-hemolysin-like protein